MDTVFVDYLGLSSTTLYTRNPRRVIHMSGHAAQFNMNANQGADFVRTFKLKDGSGNTDITGYTLTAKVKQFHTATASQTFTITKTNASHGEFTMALTETQTAAMKAGTHQYDLLSDDGSGETTCLIRGYFELEPGISQ